MSRPAAPLGGATFTPPPRFAGARFETYEPQNAAQADALADARAFTERIRARHAAPRWRRLLSGNGLLGRDDGLGAGLYLVGPVGTGKTHLLASIYHALHAPAAGAEVPSAFVHSSQLFRATERPADYAAALAARFRVLLIDEVELDDPAAEVRLIGVLKTLRRLGVTVAATSNAEPERFVSAQFGRDRLERFISEEFRRQYHVLFVGGEDYRQRLAKPGRLFVGPPEATHAALDAAFDAAPEPRLRLPFAELLRRAAATERGALAAELAAAGTLFIEGVAIGSTDDALRLLRVIDDLYAEPEPPVLVLSAERLPEAWFPPEAAGQGLARGIAEKFARTVSRVHALCAVERVGRAADVPG